MSTVSPIKPAPVATNDQRMKIRGYLDKHFDDAAGIYLDDFSDHKIAEIIDVPRIIVETIRENAYGPIKINPEIVALRNEFANLRREIDAQQKGLDALKVKATGMESRLVRTAA